MNSNSFAIITPSYAPDFERCRLLSWSIEQFIAPSGADYTHYIIVDARDLPLFRQLQNSKTEIISVESIFPGGIYRLPFVKNGWFSFKTGLIRNWLLQQIVKLAVPLFTHQDVLIFADSDVAFIRPLDLQTFVRDGQVRLFRTIEHTAESIKASMPGGYDWYVAASQLVGLEPPEVTRSYVGNVITWRRDNVLKLHQQIEQTTGRGWIEAISRCWHFSEYTLYGTFVEKVLQQESGHFPDSTPICGEYWGTEALSDDQLKQFFAGIEPSCKSVMISAKAHIPVERYQSLISA